ncbi:MAG: hypothetical protein GMKNLPBB_01553 [Myxococcota bacterium]|nr:hypothetical protein [Myxococcota bacterium]
MHMDGDDEEEQEPVKLGATEFVCPGCNAYNPLDEPLKNGMEVQCNYCGNTYKAKIMESGRIKFRET